MVERRKYYYFKKCVGLAEKERQKGREMEEL